MWLAREKPSDIRDERNDKRGEHRHPASQMEVKDALDFVHRALIGRDEERRVTGKEHQTDGEDRDWNASSHCWPELCRP